jgi:hypothetical protein
MRPFQSRPIHPRGVTLYGEWRLKRYTIVRTPNRLRRMAWPDFEPGRACHAALPSPVHAAGRVGSDFIEHRGNGADYIVLGWWERENELPVRVFVRDHSPGAAWRAARGSESFCVWDLQVVAFERDAYVGTVLSERASEGAVEDYLARRLTVAP